MLTEKEIKKQLYSHLQKEGVEMMEARELINDCNIIDNQKENNVICASWLCNRWEERFNVADGELVKFDDLESNIGPHGIERPLGWRPPNETY